MDITLTPEMETRLANLAYQMGFTGSDGAERALKAAVDALEAKLPQSSKPSPEEIAAEMTPIVAAARRWRAGHPFDDDNPPSKVWQEELYDDRGLPK